MAKKRISAEERKEFKGGKYMGGPAEEKSEKKKKGGKRMAYGGSVGYGGNKTNDPIGRGGMGGTGLGGVSGGMNAGGGGRGGPAGGVTTGTMTGTSARNMRGTSRAPEFKAAGPSVPMNRPTMPRMMNRPAQPVIQTPLEEYTPPEVTDDMLPAPPQRGLSYNYNTKLGPGMSLGNYMRNPTAMQTRDGQTRRGLKAGGLARKGKTMAKGGLVKGCGCAAKGVKKPRYT